MASKNNIDILINATDNASGVLKNTQKSISDLWNETHSLWRVWEENKGKITAAAWVAFAWISYYLKQWIDDINEYNYSIKRLESLTKNSTWATKEQTLALVKHAESLEKVWVATKDNIVAWMSQFATFDMSTEAIDRLTDSFVDYVVAEKWATASSEEYRQMANWLAQALQWNYASLTRTWFILDEQTKYLIENWDEMQRVNAIVDVLNTTYKDFNKTATETAEGKMILLKRSFDDIRETIAIWFLPIIESVTESIQKVVSKVGDRVHEHPKLASSITWIVIALTGLVTVFWTISLALPAISTAISLLTWPVWLVIAALTALSVAYETNFWGFRDFVNEVWWEISPLLIELAQAFNECFWEIWKCIKEVYKELEPLLIPLWEVFKEVVKDVLWVVVELVVINFKVIAEIIKWLASSFSEIIDFLKNVFSGNWEWALENLKNIADIWKDAVINIFAAFWIDLPEMFENLKAKLINIRDTLFWGLKNICSWAVDWISDKISAIWDKINAARDAIASLWWGENSNTVSWWRASWWTVLAGQTYRVNEIRWEYFTPSVNWTISASPQNWGPNVTINFGNVILNNWDDVSSFAERVRGVMIEVFRNKALWTYT